MKKIITALANPILNENLKKEKDFEILTKDIQYQEGIFEIMEEKNEIDYLILSEILPGENNIEKLIEKIKEKNIKIEIIIILESKKEKLENILYKKGILKIYYNNEVEINEIISFIKNENNSIPLRMRVVLEAIMQSGNTQVLPKRAYEYKDFFVNE